MVTTEKQPANYPFQKLLLEWLSGGLANAFASAILNPMDVAKTRMQVENMKVGATKTTLLDNFRTLYKEGGAVGLWKPGLQASMLRDMVSSGLRAGFYVPVRSKYESLLGDRINPSAIKILAALTTGTLGALLANPIDVVKIRLMINPSSYPSVFSALSIISNVEGFRSLYKGLIPSTLRGACVAVGEYATYDISKTLLRRHLDVPEGIYLHTFSSLIAGLCATTVAAPFDLLKTRAMNNSGAPIGLLNTLINVIRTEGPTALFRGWLPAYLRLGPHALICFPVFEQLRKLMGLSFI